MGLSWDGHFLPCFIGYAGSDGAAIPRDQGEGEHRRRRMIREDEYAKQKANIQRKMETLQERAAETFKD